MAKYKHFPLFMILLLVFHSCKAQNQRDTSGTGNPASLTGVSFLTGASQGDVYLPFIRGKRIGVVANQTSVVDSMHLVDYLVSKGVNVEKVFAPEHGFRGEAGPGDKVASGKDDRTGLPIVSLYGSHRKPTPADINGLEYMIFDIQDVGARFYTYISTLHYVMEACAEAGIPVMVLDRPNPNGFYIDGPVLDTAFRSFVGIAPIPVVHGLTVGEYALMANGEGWLTNRVQCSLKVIAMQSYTHSQPYELPVRPSPNLPNATAVLLYPSLCFFEGAAVSVGRGTEFPFQVMGFPGYNNGNFKFTPREIPGIIKDPPYEDKECNGKNMAAEVPGILKDRQLKLEWLIEMYNGFPDKVTFFNNFFDKLAGTDQLRKQIIAGKTLAEIRKGWQPAIDDYKKARKKYLLYAD